MSGEATIWNPRTLLQLSSDTKRIEQRFTASAGQTLFTLTEFAYVINTGSLAVFHQSADAVSTDKGAGLLANTVNWAEGTATTFSLVLPAAAGDQIIAVGYVAITGSVDVRDTDIYVSNYQAIRDYAGTEITLYAQGEITIGDEGEHFFAKITGAAVGFFVDNDFDTIVPTGGDGSTGWICKRTASEIPRGLNIDGTLNNTVILDDSNFTANSTVTLPSGLIKMNKWMALINLQGNGASTNIEPFSEAINDGFALSLGGHLLPHGNWDKHYVRDLSIDTGGSATGGGCIRFQKEGAAEGDDTISGAYVLENLSLRANNGKCVEVPRGSIGNIFNNIAYHTCDYGHWATNNQSTLQHTGSSAWNDCHWQRCDLACIYLSDSAAGRGGWQINGGVMEQNAGFGVFCKATAGTEAANSSPLTLDNLWFEKNGTESTNPPGGPTVTIDSIVYTPKDMYFENFNQIVLKGVYAKSMTVVNSDVTCHDCRHDSASGFYSVEVDDDATITIDNPSGSTGFGTVDLWSHTAPKAIPAYVSNRSPSLRMAHRWVNTLATSKTLISEGFEGADGAHNLTGGEAVISVQIAGDGLTQDFCAEYTVSASKKVNRTISATMATAKWTVVSIGAKMISGLANIDILRVGVLGGGTVTNIRRGLVDEWITTVSLVDMRVASALPNIVVEAETNSGGSVVFRLADYQIKEFDTKQEAVDFIHSGAFDYTSGKDLLDAPDVVTDTAACSLLTKQSNLDTTGAATPTLADGFEGQVKTIYHNDFAGAAEITPANMHGGTSIATSAAGQTVVFLFTDGAWTLIGNAYGLTIT